MATTKAKKKAVRPVQPLEVPPDVEAALSIRKIAALMSYSRATITRMIRTGEYPPPDFNDHGPRWHKQTHNDWYRANYRKLKPED